jgi:hypothetical protein
VDSSALRVLALACVCAALGCGGDPVIAPRIDPDLQRECAPDDDDAGDLPGCGAGEVCLEGRCYEQCSEDSECGPSEACSSSGACVASDEVRDAGPIDPCASVACTAPQVCHPHSGTCTDCSERSIEAAAGSPGACPDTAPICDIAVGRCVAAPTPSHCTPCNADSECVDPTLVFTGTCQRLGVMGIPEQVCLMSCTDTCPMGLTCTNGFCVPPLDVPCTNWRNAVVRASCLADDMCAALDGAIYPGACEGEDPAMVPPINGICLQPCSATADCFNSAAGQTCTGTDFFCRP